MERWSKSRENTKLSASSSFPRRAQARNPSAGESRHAWDAAVVAHRFQGNPSLMEQMRQKMSFIQTFKMMYTKKSGEPSTDFAAEKFVEIDQIVSGHSTYDTENIVGENENQILTQVLGKEHPGKPRCYGSFVTSTDIHGSKKKCDKFARDCQKACEMKEELDFMKNKMLEMETNYKSLQE
ncbi:hypothetical protein Taro_007091 [Colocasia esculenta]|uniref:Uncharacterized protein n=1 Tax=Colocasia esculenta TaxID=4460 RepID=A0A843U2V2_COLES|nr:hypothetical protein [Colocasia esculenta]